ncbi:MAG: GGDEF domain-containing protein [Planctomycetes bacterium]|nr:GGDEF domain-containing protein [Planctomycetota bacterium]
MDRLEEAIRQADRHCQPLSIAMADIDFFKRFNDRYGHLCGDAVLREFSVILKSGVRVGVDIPARYGEEFLLILPFTDLKGAGEVSERIRRAIERMVVQYDGLKLSVTCSFGVTQYQPGETMQKFIDRADEALYTAKAGGRNRVYLAE